MTLLKIILAASLALVLSGCASGCREACLFGVFGPGNASFDRVAAHYDSQDRCQILSKPANYEPPGFCGAGRGTRRASILSPQGQRIGEIRY